MITINVTPESGLQAAINRLPDNGETAVLRLSPGVYEEKVELRRDHTALIGSGAGETIVRWHDAAAHVHPDGRRFGTFRSYTMLVLANDCRLSALTVENNAGPRSACAQCVALFADGDLFTCEDCRLLSHQDTLFTAPLPPHEVQPGGFLGPTQHLPRKPQRHTYRRCTIKGDVDFIYGGAAAWFEDCNIVSLDEGYATAASTPEGQKYGYVFRNCRFTGENVPNGSCYLGRPWREFAKTLLIGCEIGPHIKPEGWHDWNRAAFAQCGDYAESGSYGPGSSPEQRAPFSRQMTAEEAQSITYEDFMASL